MKGLPENKKTCAGERVGSRGAGSLRSSGRNKLMAVGLDLIGLGSRFERETEQVLRALDLLAGEMGEQMAGHLRRTFEPLCEGLAELQNEARFLVGAV